MGSDARLAVLSVALIVARVAHFVTSPLWLDGIGAAPPRLNCSRSGNETETAVSAYFVTLAQQSYGTVVFGLLLAAKASVRRFRPARLAPKRDYVLFGLADAVATMLLNVSASGQRTAPYLQGILANFNIPVTFAVRFVPLP